MGGRRGVRAVEYDIVKSGHGHHQLPADGSTLHMRELIPQTRPRSQ
jgi:hypothetical protein